MESLEFGGKFLGTKHSQRSFAQEKKFEKLASGSSEIQSFASCFGHTSPASPPIACEKC